MALQQVPPSSLGLLGLEYPAGAEPVCRHISPEVATKLIHYNKLLQTTTSDILVY